MMHNVRHWKHTIVGSAAGLALFAGTIWAAPAPDVAQADAPAAVSENVAGNGAKEDVKLVQFRPGGGLHAAAGLGEEILANALGITTAELQTARQNAFAILVAQAVEEGEITQERADAMLERNRFGARGLGRVALRGDHMDALAQALDISVEELEAAIDNAPDAAVGAGLLTQAQADALKFRLLMRNAMTEARETAIQQAVAAGLITQAQADQMLDNGGLHFGPRHGGHIGGRGRMRNSFERGGLQRPDFQRPGRDAENNRFGPGQFAPQPEEEETPLSQSSISL